jgi:hypothetical protein
MGSSEDDEARRTGKGKSISQLCFTSRERLRAVLEFASS